MLWFAVVLLFDLLKVVVQKPCRLISWWTPDFANPSSSSDVRRRDRWARARVSVRQSAVSGENKLLISATILCAI